MVTRTCSSKSPSQAMQRCANARTCNAATRDRAWQAWACRGGLPVTIAHIRATSSKARRACGTLLRRTWPRRRAPPRCATTAGAPCGNASCRRHAQPRAASLSQEAPRTPTHLIVLRQPLGAARSTRLDLTLRHSTSVRGVSSRTTTRAIGRSHCRTVLSPTAKSAMNVSSVSPDL